jgi:hypothetical protein
MGRVIDWTTVAELGTASGTPGARIATFAAVRSSNRSARLAERSLSAQLRPLLLPSHLEDPPEKVGFPDEHWVHVPGGKAHAEATDRAIYLVITVRNVGTGLAVLNGWAFYSRAASGSSRGSRWSRGRTTPGSRRCPTTGTWTGPTRGEP